MAAELTLYTFEDRDGNEFGSFSTQDYAEAREYASRYRLRIIENLYEWADSMLAADYTDPDPADLDSIEDEDDGTNGQDRDSYSDTQDREHYTAD